MNLLMRVVNAKSLEHCSAGAEQLNLSDESSKTVARDQIAICITKKPRLYDMSLCTFPQPDQNL